MVNEIEKEMNTTNQMLGYFGKNMDELSIAVQLQVLSEFVKFSEALKPLYAVALALRGDKKEVKTDD